MRPERGFTLLEVLIALAVIGIALGAAVKAGSQASERAFDLRQRTLAGWIASNRINELLATRSFPAMGAVDGEASEGKYDFVWRQETGPTPNLSFRRVEVKVFAKDAPEAVVARQVTYVARIK